MSSTLSPRRCRGLVPLFWYAAPRTWENPFSLVTSLTRSFRGGCSLSSASPFFRRYRLLGLNSGVKIPFLVSLDEFVGVGQSLCVGFAITSIKSGQLAFGIRLHCVLALLRFMMEKCLVFFLIVFFFRLLCFWSSLNSLRIAANEFFNHMYAWWIAFEVVNVVDFIHSRLVYLHNRQYLWLNSHERN